MSLICFNLFSHFESRLILIYNIQKNYSDNNMNIF